jgi:hypothetical protein
LLRSSVDFFVAGTPDFSDCVYLGKCHIGSAIQLDFVSLFLSNIPRFPKLKLLELLKISSEELFVAQNSKLNFLLKRKGYLLMFVLR